MSIFHLKENHTSVKTEIIGGLLTFVAMCYILPVNSSMLASMGMNSSGVFATTAIVSCIVTLIMAFVANYPVVLSAGMGLNAFIAYTLSNALFDTWQQKMILLTVAGLIFFVFSLTPVRKWIIEAIPKDLKCMISASLGAFILFVGLKGAGLIASDASTFVTLGNFLDPAVIIGFICIIGTIGLSFVHNKMISTLAIPLGILSAAIIGLIVSIILKETGHLISTGSGWVYDFGFSNPLTGQSTLLPIAPWYDSSLHFGLDTESIKDVVFFGLATDQYGGEEFGKDLIKVFTTPASYIAIFSLVFVNLFGTTATLIAVGENADMIDENGKMKKYRRTILADATGALISGPFGTSTVTPFVESNVGVSMGARTGLSALSAALLFLLSIFIYPIFSIFTAGSVTAPALVGVGILIVLSSLKGINVKDPAILYTTVIGIAFALLTYSISNGIGFGLIAYCVILLFSKRSKEISPIILIISILFLVSFALNAILPLFS